MLTQTVLSHKGVSECSVGKPVCCCMLESGGYAASSEGTGTGSGSPGLPLSLQADPAPAPSPPPDPSSLTELQPPPGSFQPATAFTHHYTGRYRLDTVAYRCTGVLSEVAEELAPNKKTTLALQLMRVLLYFLHV